MSVIVPLRYWLGFENLIKDIYLRLQMNENGWAPISLLASFPRLRAMTTDISVLREACVSSSILELDAHGHYLRLKDDWQRWILPFSPGARMTHHDSDTVDVKCEDGVETITDHANVQAYCPRAARKNRSTFFSIWSPI